jgi:pSer/pThr/pTyr-binding forkhead associated (FHA) protein
MTAAAVKFKQSNVPRQPGEGARLKVVQGPDIGAVYVIVGPRAAVGRGDENDIMILDLKASRKHALFSMKGSAWEVSDNGSANGILVNGKNVRSATLRTGDTVTLGETTLEFMASGDSNTMMLTAPASSMTQIIAQQKAPTFGAGGAAGGSDSKKKLLILAAAAGFAFLLFGVQDPADKKAKPAKKNTEEKRDLASYLPTTETAPNKVADSFFRAGLREYRAGNYIRAKQQFETALQIVPGHTLATLYLRNCDKSVEEDVKKSLYYGKKNMDAGKLRSAKANFEAVMRLLYRDQTNPSYLEAKENLEKVNKEIGEGS